ncbi:murein hydrolase activator EnvC family protein [Aurantiacibacter poecillastricola]|uniref:murein hydrolase activator EnvC family protein n=1 Tax=Aurantiacibacter poecillastricola TaxID=3064385 RepID=UPI00273F4607|nr:peptidoglycan DD-metalloendopeptidase family protein [Aurantiacibacter sp. 219JJ12-13]MDP5260461.1 peptidoglycan DD-metalloendopeptidase family protein [Aurantiacibacter sp. 219JJ12-13]
MHRIILLAGSLVFCAVAAFAQRAPTAQSPEELRAELAEALAERENAEARSERFEEEAREAEDAAQRAARQAAALAARIQQAEAGLSAARTRVSMIDRERDNLREELGREQQPVVELTAALQQFSRRPLALSILRPGSVRDVVYLRAMLHNAVPEVQGRTASLRGRIDRARELRREAVAAAQLLEAEESTLAERRRALADIETRERLAARSAGGRASREADRALALAEEARDLDGLVTELDRAATLRQQLAALPGPRLRPSTRGEADADESLPAGPEPSSSPQGRIGPPEPYILPAAGRTLIGFGAPQPSGPSRGLTLAPIAGAQVVAPADGRIAFAGPYRGYGQIVIIEHGDGWTSLVTGLARTSVEVGEDVVGGAPLGLAAPTDPAVTLELRRDNEPVNPAAYVGR